MVEAYTLGSTGYASRVVEQAVPSVRSCVLVRAKVHTLLGRLRGNRDSIGLVQTEKDIDINEDSHCCSG